jgi:hypothetical protein
MSTKAFSANAVNLFIGTDADALVGSMTILMKTNKYYTDGTLLKTGLSYTVTRAWGQMAVDRAWAGDTADVLPVEDTPNINGDALSALVAGAGPLHTPMVTVFAGNSIVDYGRWAGVGANGGYTNVSEMGYMQQFAGLRILQSAKATAGTYTDACGNYGHSGYSISQILAELVSVHFAALDAAGIIPDLWIGLALYENDASTDVASATTIAASQKYWALVRAKYPGVRCIDFTPRPDGRINTVARRTNQEAVYQYLLAKDDGVTMLIVDATHSSYEDPTNPYNPLPGYTYSAGVSDPITSVSGVHPRQNAACINGRLGAAAVLRLVGEPTNFGNAVVSGNNGLFGSGAYALLKTTGTMPTGCTTVLAPAGATASIVSTALVPGWRLLCTADAATPSDVFHVQLAGFTPSPLPARFRLYMRVKINSGAAGLASIVGRAVATYTDASAASTMLSAANVAVAEPNCVACVYQDGDELTLFSPDFAPNTLKTINQITTYIRAYSKSVTPFELEITQIGFIPEFNVRAPAALTPSGSPYSYQNVTADVVDVVVTGGTVSAIDFSRDGGVTLINYAAASPAIVQLNPGDLVKVTYIVAPTMTAIQR